MPPALRLYFLVIAFDDCLSSCTVWMRCVVSERKREKEKELEKELIFSPKLESRSSSRSKGVSRDWRNS